VPFMVPVLSGDPGRPRGPATIAAAVRDEPPQAAMSASRVFSQIPQRAAITQK
jgi:hypothetical protein